jgi:hypothetical protein
MALTLTDDDIAKINALIDGKLNALKNEATDVTSLSESTESTMKLLGISSGNTLKNVTVKKSNIKFITDEGDTESVDILQ